MVKSEEDKATSQKAVKYVKDALISRAPNDAAIKEAVVKETTVLDAPDAKYVMNRLANYKQDAEKQVVVGETNLEHIYPQNPAENEWGGKANQERLEPFTWHIGNLTIFGKRANRKVANLEYPLKRPKYAQSKVVMSNEIATNYDQWDEKTILTRAGHLAKLVVEVWNFDNPSRV